MNSFPHLFAPLQVGSITLKNRIVSTAHAPALSEKDGTPGQRERDYFEAKARGGAGLVMFGGSSSVHERSPATEWSMIANRDERIIAPYQALADAIHKHGAKTITQLTHMGPRAWSDTEDWLALWGPTQMPEPLHNEVPHEMSGRDIREVVLAFGAACKRAKQGGLDGVEIVLGSGHLLATYLSPFSNHRTDKYGGSLDNRMRFFDEVTDEIRKQVGREFVLGVRLTGDEFLPNGLSQADMLVVTQRIARTKQFDFISVWGSTAVTFENLAAIVPGAAYPPAVHAYLAEGIRGVVEGLPIIYAGRVNSPQLAEKLLAEGSCDLVAMTRAMFADPDMPNKARAGRLDDIRPCVGANQGCIGRIYMGKTATCVHNPMISRERELAEITPAPVAKNVLVVGGGPAGLEAARVARVRGHRVTLLEKSDQLGGLVRVTANAPRRSEWRGITDWLENQCRKLGVEIKTGVTATAESVRALAPDAVIIATGARAYRPPVPGADFGHVYDVADVVAGKPVHGKHVVVVDDVNHQAGLNAAEMLLDRGHTVQVITRGTQVGSDIDATTFPPLFKALFSKGVVFTPNTGLIAIDEASLVVENVWSHTQSRIEDIDAVVLATGFRSVDEIYRQLDGHMPELHVVGDAMAPRKLPNAVLEGTRAGRAV
jgi:dimethylglycine catabolism A